MEELQILKQDLLAIQQKILDRMEELKHNAKNKK